MIYHSYPGIYILGHKAIADIFEDEVVVQEKIDGSFLAWWKDEEGLHIRSKNAAIYPEKPGMFQLAVSHLTGVCSLLLDDTLYFGEYLSKRKHNVLLYDRVPVGNIVLFDVAYGEQMFFDQSLLASEANRIQVERVPVLFNGKQDTAVAQANMLALLETESQLGGTKIEGVVVKNYSRYTEHEKKIMVGKLVSPKFKEVAGGEWKSSNPGRTDVINRLIKQYTTEARWQKAVQHLRERGEIEDSPRDIGKLIREIPEDILREEGEAIKEQLFKHFWPVIERGVTRGMPEWWKEKLVRSDL